MFLIFFSFPLQTEYKNFQSDLERALNGKPPNSAAIVVALDVLGSENRANQEDEILDQEIAIEA